MMRHIAIVFNEKSGSAANQKAEIEAACARYDITPHFVAINHQFEAALTRLQKQTPYKTVVAAGGDGTVHAVAGYAVKHTLQLGVIPIGTLNHFAKDCDLPIEVDKAIACIGRGHTRSIDTVKLGRQRFVNNSSVGLYPAMVRRRERLQKFMTKWPAMAVALVVEAALLRRHRAELVLDGKRYEYKVSFVFIGNNAYRLKQGSFERHSAMNEGRLSVYILKTARFWPMLRVAWRALRGKLEDEAAFEQHVVKTLSLRWPRKTTVVACDGEVMRLTAPLHYQADPRSLTLVSPR